MIHGVKVIPSRKICDERGMIMPMLKATDDHFTNRLVQLRHLMESKELGDELRWNDA